MLLAAALAGCDNDAPAGGPLAIDSVRPEPGAVPLEAAAAIRIYFNRALDPGSVSDSTVTVILADTNPPAGVLLPAAVTYEPGTRDIRVIAPILPGRAYRVAVSGAVTDSSRQFQAGPAGWSFASRIWGIQAADPAATPGTTIALDADADGVRAAYLDLAYGIARFAECPGACDVGSWSFGGIDTLGGDFYDLTHDPLGANLLTYGTRALVFSTCPASCALRSSWTRTVVDTSADSTGTLETWTAVALSPAGAPRVSYFDAGTGHLRYAECDSACADSSRWRRLSVDSAGAAGEFTSLSIAENGTRHLAYYRPAGASAGVLKYATCASGCDTGAGWDTVTVDGSGDAGFDASLSVDGGGRLQVVSYDSASGRVRYAACAAGCTSGLAWTLADATGGSSPVAGLAAVADSFGRVHVVYQNSNDELHYLVCALACSLSSHWRDVIITGASAWPLTRPAIALDPSRARLHFFYTDAGTRTPRHVR